MVGQLVGKPLNPKYTDLGSVVVKVCISKISISNTLIDLGETINVMTKGVIETLNIQNLLRQTTIVLQNG